MTNEQLTSLLLQLGDEIVSFGNDPDEIALHSSTFCADNQNFKAAVEEAINLWVCKGVWPADLARARRFNIWIRFYLAFAVLSEFLYRRVPSAFVLLLRVSLLLPASEPEPLSDFDESIFDEDRESILRALLIENWNKAGESDLANLAASSLVMISKLSGFRYCPPQLGHDTPRE